MLAALILAEEEAAPQPVPQPVQSAGGGMPPDLRSTKAPDRTPEVTVDVEAELVAEVAAEYSVRGAETDAVVVGSVEMSAERTDMVDVVAEVE